MTHPHLMFAWCWILVGLVAGAAIGLFIHDENWLGGYGSWRRRMLRLGHVAFLGTGLLNLAFVLTARFLDIASPPLAAAALIAGALAMPAVCFLSAWRPAFRHLFPFPVAGLIVAVVLLLIAAA